MIALKLAMKNLLGAGLRTWLNAIVLSIALISIIFYNGLLDGWNLQAHRDSKDWHTGNGQIWHQTYDPYDPFSLEESHSKIPEDWKAEISKGQIAPILMIQATIYPQGRMMSAILKGIDYEQKVVKIPSYKLHSEESEIYVAIGKRMAKSANLKINDRFTVRWRDKNGTFDACEFIISEIFDSDVPAIDQGQVWLSLSDLQKMTDYKNEATMFVVGDEFRIESNKDWQFKEVEYLLKDLDNAIQIRQITMGVLNALLLCIALLAVFDTQILSIFRRQKEIGTYIALGITPKGVTRIFTIEGAAHSLFAIFIGVLWGFPFLSWVNNVGIPMPEFVDSAGFPISEKIMPYYSSNMILTTILIIMVASTVVSYLPSRKISMMSPTDALKGKIQ